jgi:hypothetical protein
VLLFWVIAWLVVLALESKAAREKVAKAPATEAKWRPGTALNLATE